MFHEVLLIKANRTGVVVEPCLETSHVMRAYGRCSLDLREGVDKIICDNRQITNSDLIGVSAHSTVEGAQLPA